MTPQQKAREYAKKWRLDHPDYIKQWRLDHPDDIDYRRKYSKQWRLDHPDYQKKWVDRDRAGYNKKRNVYMAIRKTSDMSFVLERRLRSRLRNALNGNFKCGSAVRDLGCSIVEFKKHIESQFQSGMTWDNRSEWHLDHIIPLSKFDLTDRQQLLIAFNYTNYQPMWKHENLVKHNLHVLDFKGGMF
jgi:hypothetical protein